MAVPLDLEPRKSGCLLVAIAWLPGGLIGRSWLPLLPAIAAFFDLKSGFSLIPLFPSLFHIAALIAGATGEVSADLKVRDQIARPGYDLGGLGWSIDSTSF